MGTSLTGREVIVGLKKAVTWRTAVACGAGDGLLVLSESLKQTIEDLIDDSMGSMWSMDSDQGKLDAGGALDGYMRYEMFETALALCMGTAGSPAQQGSTAAHLGSLELADNIVGQMATIATLKKSDKVFEYPTVKISGFKISGSMREPVKLSLTIIASKEELGSIVNTSTTIANVTMPTVSNRIIMNANSVFRINDQSSGALDVGDIIYPSSFDLEFTRPMEGDLTAGNDDQDEPGGTGFPTASLSLNFPRYNDATHQFFTDHAGHTSKKGDITFTGNVIEGAYNYSYTFQFPHMKVSSPDAPASGVGKIPVSVKYNLLGASSAPAGMAGITKPLQIDYQNTRTTDPLA